MKLRLKFYNLAIFLTLSILAASCQLDAPTFPEERIKEHIKEICLKDYGIENVEVKIVGKTLGVHLPLDQLFEKDIEALMASGKVKDVETLLQLSPDAIDKIQDVIFTTSRVIFSSDSDIDFYVMKATDYDNTGIEFILANYVQDVKRVRFWDIPLSEYYKRSFRDMRMNRSVFLKKPALDLFQNVGKMNLAEIFKRYFASKSTLKDISPFFYAILMEYEFKNDIDIEILKSKARVFKADEILVYMKIREDYKPKPKAKNHKFIYPSGTVLEYIFILKPVKDEIKIARVLPFNYISPDGTVKKIEFPSSLKLYENIDTWPSDFGVEELFLDEFIAAQIARRVQMIYAQDAKAMDAFEKVEAQIGYYPKREGKQLPILAASENLPQFFECQLELKPHNTELQANSPDFIKDPAVEHAITLLLKEFVSVVRSYDFNDYSFLRFRIKDSSTIYELSRDALQAFRKKRPSTREILEKAVIS